MTARLVSLAVPVTIDRGFTYRVPDTWTDPLLPGTRVLAPFGPRVLVAVVRSTVDTTTVPTESADSLKDLLARLDDDGPALAPDLVRLCEWISDYYLAPIGEVYRLALPGLLTNTDARRVTITARGQQHTLLGATLSTPQARALERVATAGPGGISVAELARTTPRIPGLFARLHELAALELVTMTWDDDDTRGRTELHVRRTGYLRGSADDEDALQRLLGRSKQRRALLDHLEARLGDDTDGWIAITELRGPFPRARALLEPLLAANLVVAREQPRALDPFALPTHASDHPRAPTLDQSAALDVLAALLAAHTFASVLLHGITGSGKTEVYLQLIARARAKGHGAIVLVPEIALTPQLAERFRARFGEAVAVLHSGLTPRQRLDAWQQIRSGERSIVIGARSAVFAPVAQLAVIVVDEEHDPSFKQEDGVRYHARDVALVRGRDVGAVVVLGSATPSLESWSLARLGRHRLLQLHSRPTPRPLPTVEIVPLALHRPDPESMLTARLRQAIRETVDAGEQAIVFLNRRGFTTTLVCEACGSLMQCPDCSAPSMTYHLARNRLMCHLCGHIEAPPERCPKCGHPELRHGGVGTERVEVAIERELAGVRVLRLDRDTARGRQLLDTLERFRRGDADVLVGTQMLSKGHDFPGVTLVGILQGDHGLALPDPRAAERTFQLLTQVAGRAGRGDRPGRVIVQALAVKHPAIRFAAAHDFEGFAALELEQRAALGNPPSGHLALVRISGLEHERVAARAARLAAFLKPGIERLDRGPAHEPAVALLGPVVSPLARINRRTRFQILLRSRTRAPLRWLLEHLRPELGSEGQRAQETAAFVDVDPQTLL